MSNENVDKVVSGIAGILGQLSGGQSAPSADANPLAGKIMLSHMGQTVTIDLTTSTKRCSIQSLAQANATRLGLGGVDTDRMTVRSGGLPADKYAMPEDGKTYTFSTARETKGRTL